MKPNNGDSESRLDPFAPQSTYLGATFVQVQVAPYRRAFLVRRDDVEQLRAVLLAAATIWGGLRSPIIPVESDGSVEEGWLQIANSLNPDSLVDFTRKSLGEPSAWRAIKKSPWPVHVARPLDDERFWNIHPFATYSAETLEREEFFLPRHESPVNLAGAGHVALRDERDMWSGLGARIVENASDIQLGRAQVGDRTVLSTTLRGDHDAVSVAPTMNTISFLWVVRDPYDVDAVLWFWNLRAVRPRSFSHGLSVLVGVPVVHDPEFQEEFRSAVARTALTDPDLLIASRDIDGDELSAIADELGFSFYSDSKLHEKILGQRSPSRSLTYKLNNDPRAWWIGNRSTGSSSEVSANLERPATKVRAGSPRLWHPKANGRVVFTVRT